MPLANPNDNFTRVQKLLALSVHIFTASGVIAALMAIIAIGDQHYVKATLWLLLALFIDGIDGTFARLFKVKQILPNIDGKSIDYVIDFSTYAIIPGYFMYETFFPDEFFRIFCLSLALLTSALYYGLSNMVSGDKYFVGFPVMWNLVAFYLYFVLPLSGWWNVFIILLLSIAHFFPLKFVYPSQTKLLMPLNIAVTAILMLTCLGILLVWQCSAINICGLGSQWQFLRPIALICLVYLCSITAIQTYIDAKNKLKTKN